MITVILLTAGLILMAAGAVEMTGLRKRLAGTRGKARRRRSPPVEIIAILRIRKGNHTFTAVRRKNHDERTDL